MLKSKNILNICINNYASLSQFTLIRQISGSQLKVKWKYPLIGKDGMVDVDTLKKLCMWFGSTSLAFHIYQGELVFCERSDVTRWKQGYIRSPPPYFILWTAVTSLGKNKVI